MKKLISLVLALVFVFSMATVAMATDDAAWDGTYAASDATSFKIYKDYTSEETFAPAETLTFTVEAADTNPDTTAITVPNVTITGSVLTDIEITVNVPSYSKAGIYEYTIKENAGTAAGATYDTDKTIYVQILVEYDNVNHKLVIGNPKDATNSGIVYFIKQDSTGNKVDTFANTFKTNDFTVAKDVTGNMANETDTFEIVVTLTVPTGKTICTPITIGGVEVAASEWTDGVYTATLNLSENGGATTFANIPAGVTVSVEETSGETNMKGYTLTGYSVNGGDAAASASFTVDGDATSADSVVVINDKTTDVNTGITLDSLPFVLILAVCVGAAVLFVVKRRTSVDF